MGLWVAYEPKEFPIPSPEWYGRNERHTQHAKWGRNGRREGGGEVSLTACSARDGLPSSSIARARDSMLHPSPPAACAGAGGWAADWGAGSISTSGGSIGGALDPSRRRVGSSSLLGGWLADDGPTAAAAMPRLEMLPGGRGWRLLCSSGSGSRERRTGTETAARFPFCLIPNCFDVFEHHSVKVWKFLGKRMYSKHKANMWMLLI
jgi:hypothetical protein